MDALIFDLQGRISSMYYCAGDDRYQVMQCPVIVNRS